MLGDCDRPRRMSRANLGAILPLHDVRYHAPAASLCGIPAGAKDFSCKRATPQSGGARRDRTDDLLLAKQALSQLSYGPSGRPRSDAGRRIRALCRLSSVRCRLIMVGLGRFELPTSRLSSARSNQLSYKPGSEDRGRLTEDGMIVFRPSALRPPDWARLRRKRNVDGGAPPDRRTDDRRRRTEVIRVGIPRSDDLFLSRARVSIRDDLRRPSSVL
jgi:hypothetical protein